MRYRKTISELEIFLAGHRIHVADLSEMMMADWAIDLLCQGLAVSTVTRHLNSLNGMVKDAAKAGMIKQNNAARSISKSLSELRSVPALLGVSVFDGILSFLRDSLKEREDNRYNVFMDMVLFSMLNGAISLDSVSRLKKENMQDY
ncbi:phage integrase SAM-like domain-containing protein, partial [uncultured Duncaniella sp.]